MKCCVPLAIMWWCILPCKVCWKHSTIAHLMLPFSLVKKWMTLELGCLCAVLAGLGTCTGVLWELVYAREKIHGPVICLLVLTKVEKVTLQVILGARLLPSAGFYSSTLGPGPGNPCCQQLRWWPLKAARLWCQPSGPQSNCPSAGPSCCAGSPSGTRGLPGYTGA